MFPRSITITFPDYSVFRCFFRFHITNMQSQATHLIIQSVTVQPPFRLVTHKPWDLPLYGKRCCRNAKKPILDVIVTMRRPFWGRVCFVLHKCFQDTLKIHVFVYFFWSRCPLSVFMYFGWRVSGRRPRFRSCMHSSQPPTFLWRPQLSGTEPKPSLEGNQKTFVRLLDLFNAELSPERCW